MKMPRPGLSAELKAQLLIDIVANPNLTCDEIIKIPDREYSTLDSLQSIRNRFHHLGKIKKERPNYFWTLYSEVANSGPYRDQVEEESDDEQEPAPSTPPAPFAPPARSARQRTPDTITSTPPRPPSSNSTKKKNMSGSRAKSASTPATSASKSAFIPPATSAFAYNTMFDTLEEAQDAGMYSLMLRSCYVPYISTF
jgi:hypothetical protein